MHCAPSIQIGNWWDCQALLRHHSIKVTMDVYDEAMSDENQVADRKVLHLVTRKQTPTVMRTASESGGCCKCLKRLASPTGFEPVLPP